MIERRIDEIAAIPPLGPGFGGPRHRASMIFEPGDLASTDPFFFLADDNITTAGPFGEAHPHAGLETVTFMLNGFIEDRTARLDEGDVEWMTAGSGIVHNEDTVVSAGMRLFQLWVILPEGDRNMDPRVQVLRRGAMPVHRQAGVEARVYSGRSGDAQASTLNVVPVTLADLRLEPGATFEQTLPAAFKALVVIVEGEASVGDGAVLLSKGSIGWSRPVAEDGDSRLRFTTADSSARLLLYAALPQNIEVVARGPFIAGSAQELQGYYRSYLNGDFPRAADLVIPTAIAV